MNITSANATILLTVAVLFPVPYQLTEFAADDIFGTNPIPVGEQMMGVDGNLTSGFINASTEQAYALMADSPSNYFFDQIALREKADQTKYRIDGVVLLTSVGTQYTMVKGWLKTWQPIADAKRVLQPRRHTIEWQRVIPTPS